jgi:hypothetical protein
MNAPVKLVRGHDGKYRGSHAGRCIIISKVARGRSNRPDWIVTCPTLELSLRIERATRYAALQAIRALVDERLQARALEGGR